MAAGSTASRYVSGVETENDHTSLSVLLPISPEPVQVWPSNVSASGASDRIAVIVGAVAKAIHAAGQDRHVVLVHGRPATTGAVVPSGHGNIGVTHNRRPVSVPRVLLIGLDAVLVVGALMREPKPWPASCDATSPSAGPSPVYLGKTNTTLAEEFVKAPRVATPPITLPVQLLSPPIATRSATPLATLSGTPGPSSGGSTVVTSILKGA